jgi:hypothetical protein
MTVQEVRTRGHHVLLNRDVALQVASFLEQADLQALSGVCRELREHVAYAVQSVGPRCSMLLTSSCAPAAEHNHGPWLASRCTRWGKSRLRMSTKVRHAPIYLGSVHRGADYACIIGLHHAKGLTCIQRRLEMAAGT